MTLRKYTGMAVLVALFPLAAQAQESGAYTAFGTATYDFDTYGVDAKLGYNFNRNFGVELQGVLGLTSDSQPLCSSPNCATLKQKTDYTVGLFAVGRLPLSDQFEIFARGGVHTTQYGFKINNALNTEFEADYTGVAVGAGIQYKLNHRNALRLETTYLDNADSQTSAISFVRKF